MNFYNFINKKANVVTSEITDDVDHIIVDEVFSKCRKPTSMLYTLIAYRLPDSTNPTFKSVSKCLEEDDFDEAVGIDIANNKSCMKMHHFAGRRFRQMAKLCKNACDDFERLASYHEQKEKNIKYDLDNFYK